ncbi:hypothetical protein D3C83_166610 [compost metagenome]
METVDQVRRRFAHGHDVVDDDARALREHATECTDQLDVFGLGPFAAQHEDVMLRQQRPQRGADGGVERPGRAVEVERDAE